MADHIAIRTRKRLWTKAGDRCAFPECGEALLHANEAGDRETILGIECHIVAKADDPRVARSPSSLSTEERKLWRALIENRHGLANLVLMCANHARLIDDPAQGFSVADVVEMKRTHEEEVNHRHRMALEGAAAAPGTVVSQPLLLEDIPTWQRKATAALARVDTAALAWLRNRLGTPGEPEQIVALIEAWPRRLKEGPIEMSTLLVREAESMALWTAAANGWERMAAAQGPLRADYLTRAAIDAGVGGESERREQLLRDAEVVDPDCVRTRLERLDDTLRPEDQLAHLNDLKSEDEALAALICCRRALLHLLRSDLPSAEAEIKQAASLDGDVIALRIARINLELHRARLALAADRPFVVTSVLGVYKEALEQRSELVEMGRWEESVRLLMMAADARSLLRDLDGATEVLEEARPEEIAAEQGASVLGDAALRAGAPRLALDFVDGMEPDDGLRRIAASARAELGGPDRAEALAELEHMALGDGEESEAAAAARIVLCMPPVRAPWNEEVAAELEAGDHARHARALRVLTLAERDAETAMVLANDLPDTSWGAEVRLRVAGIVGKRELMTEAAKEFLSFSPDGSGRLLAARALGQAGDFERAMEVAALVARDPNVPALVRSDAFHVTMKTLADCYRWDTAEQTWQEWRDLCFDEMPQFDGRISAWQVRVLHNRPKQPSQSV